MKKINVLLSTFFGYGYLTKIPGTVTSAVTTVFLYVAYEVLGYTDLKELINLKGKTVEKLGLIGKEKAIACEVICSITQ